MLASRLCHLFLKISGMAVKMMEGIEPVLCSIALLQFVSQRTCLVGHAWLNALSELVENSPSDRPKIQCTTSLGLAA